MTPEQKAELEQAAAFLMAERRKMTPEGREKLKALDEELRAKRERNKAKVVPIRPSTTTSQKAPKPR